MAAALCTTILYGAEVTSLCSVPGGALWSFMSHRRGLHAVAMLATGIVGVAITV